MRDKDDAFYSDWLNIRRTDSTGKIRSTEPIDLTVTAWGIDLAAYRILPSDLRVGAGLSWMHSRSDADNLRQKNGDQDMMDRETLTARLRWLPWEWPSHGNVTAVEIEPALGIAFAQVQRYGLAAAQVGKGGALDSTSEMVKSYITTAHRSLLALGPHAELFLNYAGSRASGFQYRFGLGVTATLLQLQDDPLSIWTYKSEHYPSSLNDFGISMRATLGFRS
jgi:hypothetical protein